MQGHFRLPLGKWIMQQQQHTKKEEHDKVGGIENWVIKCYQPKNISSHKIFFFVTYQQSNYNFAVLLASGISME